MKVQFKEVTISTKDRLELIDITDQVSTFIKECEIRSGICLVNSVHSTTAIIVNEHEPGLMRDILRKVEEEFPQRTGWSHNSVDNNAEAHLASTFLGHSKMFSVENGELSKGTWQNIFLLELDGPRTRRVIFEVLGA